MFKIPEFTTYNPSNRVTRLPLNSKTVESDSMAAIFEYSNKPVFDCCSIQEKNVTFKNVKLSYTKYKDLIKYL